MLAFLVAAMIEIGDGVTTEMPVEVIPDAPSTVERVEPPPLGPPLTASEIEQLRAEHEERLSAEEDAP